jgi:hypothetical protein
METSSGTRKENVIETVTSRLRRLGDRPTYRLQFGLMELSSGTRKENSIEMVTSRLRRLSGQSARIYRGGDQYWYKEGKLHRESASPIGLPPNLPEFSN